MNRVLGFIVLAIGLVCAFRPYGVALLEEQIDAIGSTRSWSEVEPAGWNVTLTRLVGIGMILFGVLVLLDV